MRTKYPGTSTYPARLIRDRSKSAYLQSCGDLGNSGLVSKICSRSNETVIPCYVQTLTPSILCPCDLRMTSIYSYIVADAHNRFSLFIFWGSTPPPGDDHTPARVFPDVAAAAVPLLHYL